ncbi:MAG: fimbrillin family protein [Bacteroidales bacterium]|nr:fimbrillin family protein [Bacteroidales bacterium]
MKRINQYIAAVIALTMAVSCTNLIEELPSGNRLISFSPKSIETKAMVNNADITGEQFDVFDVLTVTDADNSESSSLYIENYIAYDDDAEKWAYQDTENDKDVYYWLDGTHRFFGYTHGLQNVTPPTKDNKTLSIAARTITTTSNQTDILYSDAVVTTAEAWKGAEGRKKSDAVGLDFHHLLSAISITMENYTGEELTLSSVTVSLPNNASATVNFSGTQDDPTAAVPTVAAPTVDEDNDFCTTSSITMDAGEVVDVLNTDNDMSAEGAKGTAFLIWPQTLAADAATITINKGRDDEKSVSIPTNTVWNAGEVNAYHILVYPDELKLVFNVEPWAKETIGLNTNSGSINMSNVTWMNSKVKLTADGEEKNTVVNSAYSVYMYKNVYIQPAGSTQWGRYYYPGTTSGDTYYPAQGYFTVNYPTAGLFKIGLIPAYGETEVNEDAYAIFIYDDSISGNNKWRAINADGEDLADWRDDDGGVNTIYFQVRAASVPEDNQKAQINIWFQPGGSGDWISAYSEIRANYALTITN